MAPEPGKTRGNRFDAWVRSVGDEPDPRFTLANERTFLTWMSTCLGLLGIGLGVGTLVPGEPLAVKLVAAAWITLSVVVAIRAVLRWFRIERAMRQQQALPLSRSIPLVAFGMAVLGVASAAVIAVAP